MFRYPLKLFIAILCLTIFQPAPGGLWGQESGEATSPSTADGTQPSPEQSVQNLTLSSAAMCERIENLSPVNKAITFPVSIGQVYCLTSFDPVPKGTIIYHRWFHQDRLSTQIRLKLHPPRWSTFSTIHLREADKGPWRVEITDANGQIFTVLRFSVTD